MITTATAEPLLKTIDDLDTDAAFDRYQKTRFFPALDGLRCVSILGVMAFHAGVENPTFFGNNGYLGVEFFFVISGFLITTLLLRERRDTGDISLKKFYIRRTLRIFPLYYTVLLAYCAITFFTDRHAPEGREFFHRLPIFATYTSNWFMPETGHFAISWSLSAEEQFYLFWPVLVYLLRKPWAPLVAIIAIAAGDQAVETLVNLHAVDLGEIGNRILCSLQTPICLGCVLAYVLNWRGSFRVVWQVLKRPWFPAVMLALAFAISCFMPLQLPESPDHYLIGMGKRVIFDRPMSQQSVIFLDHALRLVMSFIGCAIVGSCCAAGGGVLRSFLANRAVRYVGTISYGMYLMHQLCLKASGAVVNRIPGGPHGNTMVYCVGVCVTIAVASVSFRFYESIFLRLKDRIAKRPGRPAAIAS